MRYTDPSGHVFFTILAGALIGAAVGAGVEIVSQKVIEKKKEVDWKSVGYEAAVGAVGGAIGGVFGKAGSVIGATKKGVAKMVAKTVVKAGVSEAAGGFLEDAGRQLFVEGKGMKQLDLGRLFRTAGIAGLTGMLGSVFGMLPDLLSDYRMETVTKTVTRVKTVNKCKNNRIDCPNHPNYPVIVDRYQEVVTVPELVYVGKEGAENAAKGAAGRLDDDVAGMVARKESPLDPVKGWFQEKVDIGKRNSGETANRLSGYAEEKARNITRDDILRKLDGITDKSTEIVKYIRDKDIGINILGDQLFENYLGVPSSTLGVQVSKQIYIRRSSPSLISDIVHEGTHAIDFRDGISQEVISSWTGEIKAYTEERFFQIASGLKVDFENIDDMLVHIWSEYNK